MKSLFLFAENDSVLHRLDPRPKFLVVLTVLIYIVAFERLEFIAVALLLTVAAIGASGGSPRFSTGRYSPCSSR